MADFNRDSLMIVTPRGTAVFPKLNTPDTKFDAAGVYETKLRLSPDSDDAVIGKQSVTQAELFEALEAMRDKFLAEKKAELAASKDPKAKAKAKTISAKDIGEPGLDDDGNEDGTRIIKVKMKASGTSAKGPWTRQPKLFDAKNKTIDIKGPAIYGGSILKCAAKAVPYYMAQENSVGVSLYLEAVQVLDLVSGGGRSASAYGFGTEDGYVSETPTTGSQFSDETGTGNEDF
jgi:hypothetical protein